MIMKRTPLKKKPYTIKKVSDKQKEKNKLKKEETQKQNEFFLFIWNKSPHFCKACGQYLGEEPKTYMFDHLLEKSKYPQYRFTEENIFICCLDDHTKKTNGFPHPKHEYAIKRILQLHLNNKL